uniref:Adenylate kinase 5 n=1 Tax=Xiphophorus couchianus TaxID=32473 RepID=A0A3B5MWT7_9TELE
MNTNDAKEYLARREIPQLFESLLTGLMYYRPDDPIDYLEGCLKKVRELGGTEKVRWDTFVGQERKSLPPLNGGQSRRSLFRNGEAAERHEFKVVKCEILVHKSREMFYHKLYYQSTDLRQEFVHQPTPYIQWLAQVAIINSSHTGTPARRKQMHPICTPDLVVFLACTNSRLKERLQKRAEQQGRPDDNPKAIDRRLTNFKQNTIPLVKYFQERGLIVTLDADRDEEEVFCNISMTLDNKLFPSEEPVAGPSELDLNLLGEIGGPGSGKALQCERLEERFGLRRVTLGELLCSEMQCHSERGRHLQDVLERGEKLPEETLLELLCDAVASVVRQGKGLVVSGFPRDLKQAEEYEAKMGEPSAVVLLSCSPETMTSRVQSRSRSSLSSENALQRRAESFCSDAQAVIAHYERKMLLHTIDAERSPPEVFVQLCQAIESSATF